MVIVSIKKFLKAEKKYRIMKNLEEKKSVGIILSRVLNRMHFLPPFLKMGKEERRMIPICYHA